MVETGDDGKLAKIVDLRPAGSNNSAGYLKAQAAIHERMRWNRVSIEYVGAVGTTVGGVILIGMDWTSSVTAPTLEKLVSLTPNKQSALWDKMTMPLPASLLQPQRWLNLRTDTEADHGQLAILISGGPKSSEVGYLRINYNVTFAGTVVP